MSSEERDRFLCKTTEKNDIRKHTAPPQKHQNRGGIGKENTPREASVSLTSHQKSQIFSTYMGYPIYMILIKMVHFVMGENLSPFVESLVCGVF